ncbi:unnamed protein product [Staurois parvus]|uniref:Telomeric repeat-binding factor 2-interacting protein 1 n=1 Tax=Staurois parvus TaxID=386267 RepID=A0ABN9AT95_9NEOB|nr:unnamed protein product [Staurois parvus]
MKQRRAEKKTEEKPRNVTQMSVDEKHCGQAVESHNAESPAGQLEHTVEAETGSQKNTAKELDGQSQQIQSVIPLQVHKPAAALRQGRMAFTKEEDIAILIYIRDNASSSCTVTGNLLWKDMEKKKVLSRTWQAMKARYVKYIVDQKHKYKLPPKCSTLPSKGCSSKRKQGSDKTNSSWLNCTSTSTMTPKNCDTIHPRASTVIPQNCDTTQPSAPTDIPQNCDTIQTKASNDIPENCNATQLSASNDIPQNCDIIQPNGSADIHQNCETNLSSASVENCDPTQPSASADIPQNCDTILPSGSADIPQKCDTNLSNASADIPQNCDSTQPSISASISQNCATTQPSASTGTLQRNYTMPPTGSSITPQRANTMPSTASAVNLQKCVTMLPSASTDTLLKNDSMLPTAFAVTPKKHNTMLPSPFAHTPQKSDAMLPSTSADTYLTCSVTQHGAFTSANSLVTNIASKEQSISTLEKRSSDPTNDESPPQKKGNKMLTSHSPKTILPDREDSSDLDDLHIFEIANMEFEETDGNSGLEQPAPAVSQTENHNSALHVDETPSTSQASESEGLREAMNDMMTEFRLDVSVVTQALFFNSGELGSTRYFLRTGTRPDGYPIWEPKDDLELKNNNPKMQSHLINKYGADNVARRVAFLAS